MRLNIFRKIKKNQGVALLMSILMLSGMLIVSLGIANLAIVSMKMNKAGSESSRSFFASDAGIEETLWKVRKNSYVLPTSTTESIIQNNNLLEEEEYRVNYSTTTNDIIVESFGKYKETHRGIQVIFKERLDFCGDAIIQTSRSETCDDGVLENGNNSGGCNATCTGLLP